MDFGVKYKKSKNTRVSRQVFEAATAAAKQNANENKNICGWNEEKNKIKLSSLHIHTYKIQKIMDQPV